MDGEELYTSQWPVLFINLSQDAAYYIDSLSHIVKLVNMYLMRHLGRLIVVGMVTGLLCISL